MQKFLDACALGREPCYGRGQRPGKPIKFSDYSQKAVFHTTKSTSGGNQRGMSILSKMECDRHTLLATEDDRYWSTLINKQKAQPGQLANCRVCVISYGKPVAAAVARQSSIGRKRERTEGSTTAAPQTQPLCTLKFIISTTRLEPNTALVVNRSSIDRAKVGECEYYKTTHRSEVQRCPELLTPTQLRGSPNSPFSHWPPDEPFYYHGVGDQHAEPADETTLSYPFTLMHLQPCKELANTSTDISNSHSILDSSVVDPCATPGVGAKSPAKRVPLEVLARGDIPYGTCFAYGGAVIAGDGDGNKSLAKRGGAGLRHPAAPSAGRQRKRPSAEIPVLNEDPVAAAQVVDGWHTEESSGDEETTMRTRKKVNLKSPKVQLDKWTWEGQGQYELALNSSTSVIGKSMARFINHRYNFDPYGNLQFLCITVVTGASSGPEKERQERKKAPKKGKETIGRGGVPAVFYDEDSEHLTVIPCLMAVRDIYCGEKLLASSYGSDYDTVLERQVVANGTIIPAVASPANSHDFMRSIQVNSVVWIPNQSDTDVDRSNDLRLFSVLDVEYPYLLIDNMRPLSGTIGSMFQRPTPSTNSHSSSHAVGADRSSITDSHAHCYVTTVHHVGLLLENLDYTKAAGTSIVLKYDTLSRLSSGELHNTNCLVHKSADFTLASGMLWNSIVRNIETFPVTTK